LAKDTLRDLVANVNEWSFVSYIDVEQPEWLMSLENF
jgi:hypothetical protein